MTVEHAFLQKPDLDDWLRPNFEAKSYLQDHIHIVDCSRIKNHIADPHYDFAGACRIAQNIYCPEEPHPDLQLSSRHHRHRAHAIV